MGHSSCPKCGAAASGIKTCASCGSVSVHGFSLVLCLLFSPSSRGPIS
ncbi:BgTH12-01633 [Blumeria graminis f. sp. triticale]|uniref:BgTH12-01633 n=1 Tax=Blumeria graminis f. sp. triticale TaxID=1689686 RepID=A0A9W4GE39_BLUGR|nr:BgTH12-01633 [Blumeria graminis f. sp. triticale]